MRKFWAGFSVFLATVSLLLAQTVIQRPLNPQTGLSAGVSYYSGSTVPTAGVNGEVVVVRGAGSDSGPILGVWDGVNATFDIIGSGGAGNVPSTLASNAADVVNSVWGGTNQLIFEGGTADAGEFILTWTNSATDVTITIPADNATWAGTGSFMISTLTTNAPDAADSVTGGTNQLIFEGATADGNEVILTPADTSGDVTITFASDNATWDGAGTAFLSVLATNAPEAASSVWGISGGLMFEGATADANEISLTAADATSDQIYQLPVHSKGAGTYTMLGVVAADLTAGYFSIPPLFTHTGDVSFTSGGNDNMYVMRMYLPNPLTVSAASVLLVDGGAIAAADIVGVAIYQDADAGAKLSAGTGDGTAAGLENVTMTAVTLYPGFYRFAICTSDATNMLFAGTSFDDEQIDVISGVAGDLAFGVAANACVTGVTPATTGALSTADVALPFIYIY